LAVGELNRLAGLGTVGEHRRGAVGERNVEYVDFRVIRIDLDSLFSREVEELAERLYNRASVQFNRTRHVEDLSGG
jgi:hypothetical protein